MGKTQDAAGVNAVDESVDKSTTTEVTPTNEIPEAEELDTTKADQEIAQDLLDKETPEKDDKKEDDEGEGESDKDSEAEEESDDDQQAAKDAEEAAKAEETKQKGAEARKEQLNTEIRDLVNKRNQVRQEYEQEIAKSYRVETVEELEEKGLSAEEAENEVLRQELQMRDFNQHVADLNGTLNIEALQVMQDFPVFDPDGPMYDREFAGKVRGLYQKAANPTVDEKTGLVVKSNITPYEFYKAFADVRQVSGEQSREQGKVEGQRAADKEIAAAEIPSSAAPSKKKEDPFLKGLLSDDD